MARCTTCGALLGPDADWCGQCFSPVRHGEAEQAVASVARATPTTAPSVSPNGDSAAPSPAGSTPGASPPPLHPDVLLSLASSGSFGGIGLLGRRGRNWITAFIVVLTVGTEALFFPHVAYMLVYGIFVGVVSGYALWRLWAASAAR